jgi:carboxylesterase type B
MRDKPLDNEGHLFGNYGILDQQAVLKWVERNIGRFGRDKDNVTVGGQSAGAVDTSIHMLSPLAAGLFHRGICESSCRPFTLPTKAAAEATGVAFAPPRSAPPFDVMSPPSKEATTARRATASNANSFGVHSVGIGGLLNLRETVAAQHISQILAPMHQYRLRNPG